MSRNMHHDPTFMHHQPQAPMSTFRGDAPDSSAIPGRVAAVVVSSGLGWWMFGPIGGIIGATVSYLAGKDR